MHSLIFFLTILELMLIKIINAENLAVYSTWKKERSIPWVTDELKLKK